MAATPPSDPYFSIVVPVFNEEGNLAELHRRLRATLEGTGKTYEIVFVDDGSVDGSYARIAELHESDPNVRAIRFSRNFGHHIAITAGMDAAQGQCVCLMDADLQDQPEEIPKLHAKLLEGFDVVYGIRQNKQHSLFKRVSSRLFLLVMNAIVAEGRSINTHIFRLARRPVVRAVNACREHARFIVGLVSWVGFRQIGIPVEHGKRFAGETKYSLWKMIRLATTSMTAFSLVPLQLASYLGFAVSVSSVAFGVYLIVKKFLLNTAVEGWTSTMVSMFFLGGAQLLCLGILGAYVGRIYVEGQNRPLYIVAERVGFRDDAPL